jgi:hypothetical protein
MALRVAVLAFLMVGIRVQARQLRGVVTTRTGRRREQACRAVDRVARRASALDRCVVLTRLRLVTCAALRTRGFATFVRRMTCHTIRMGSARAPHLVRVAGLAALSDRPGRTRVRLVTRRALHVIGARMNAVVARHAADRR